MQSGWPPQQKRPADPSVDFTLSKLSLNVVPERRSHCHIHFTVSFEMVAKSCDNHTRRVACARLLT